MTTHMTPGIRHWARSTDLQKWYDQQIPRYRYIRVIRYPEGI